MVLLAGTFFIPCWCSPRALIVLTVFEYVNVGARMRTTTPDGFAVAGYDAFDKALIFGVTPISQEAQLALFSLSKAADVILRIVAAIVLAAKPIDILRGGCRVFS